MRRSLTIRTEPPGALVYVNDQFKGSSPVTYDFEWYGWHRVAVKKDGFERVDEQVLVRAPGYLWIPFDLFMELAPFPVRDARTLSYTLPPAAPPPLPTPPPTESRRRRDEGVPPAAGRGGPAEGGTTTQESTQ